MPPLVQLKSCTPKHKEDLDGALFRPVKDNRKDQESRRHLASRIIDHVLRKYARHIGLERGYSAHSMRATFITTALDNGAVSGHGGTKGANLAKVASEADRANIAVRAAVLMAQWLIGSPRPPGRECSE